MSSKTPWTPGPWVAEEADYFGDHNIILTDSADDCRAIAAVVSNFRPALEVASNARLIAAAPEMAELLRQIKSEWSFYSDTSRMSAINALLSRIEGEMK